MTQFSRRHLIQGSSGLLAAPLAQPVFDETRSHGAAQTAEPAETISLAAFAAPNVRGDASAALHRAIEALGPAGGVVEIPAGDWALNCVIVRNNITLRGRGGRGEEMQVCLRPHDLSKPTIALGDGTRDVKHCALIDLHVSGADGSRQSSVASRANAPAALRVRGGAVNAMFFNCVFVSGIHTISIQPSRTNPVTGLKFIGCTIRNDIADSRLVRGIYAKRLVEPGYLTSVKFIGTKLNGPQSGYAAEFDGTDAGVSLEVNDCYWDVRPDHGVLLRGGAGIVCHNFQLDPNVRSAVIIEVDGVIRDPARYIQGMMRHGGQKMRFADGSTLDLPEEADMFSYRQRIASPFFSDLGYFAPRSMPYSTGIYYDFATDAGPMRWHGTQHHFMDTADAEADLSHAAVRVAGGLAVMKTIRAGGGVDAKRGYQVNGIQVLAGRQSAVAPPRGGQTVDGEARRAIAELLDRLKAHGLLA